MRLALTVLLTIACASTDPVVAHQDPEVAGYVDVTGGQIWYRVNGREHLGTRAALIAIHGGPGSSHRGAMPLVELANERTVVLYDQLDSGNSTRKNETAHWTVARFVSEIDALRNALGLAEVIVIGHSWGGTLAAEYGIKSPPGVKALILSSPLLSAPQWIADASRLVDDLPAETRDTIRRHLASGELDTSAFRAAEKAFNDRHLCKPSVCPTKYGVDGPLFNARLYRYLWGPNEFYATGTLRDYDITQQMHKIRLPTMMICGEFDGARPESCRKFAAMVAGSRTVILPDATHSAALEQKEQYLEAIRSFLRDNGL